MTKPLFPLPINPQPARSEVMGGPKLPEGIESMHGHCAYFCGQEDLPTSGASVAEHGPTCSSLYIKVLHAWRADGGHVPLSLALASAYVNGVYSRESLTIEDSEGSGFVPHREWIQLSITDEEDECLYLSEGEALSLAAALQRSVEALNDRGGYYMTSVERRKANR